MADEDSLEGIRGLHQDLLVVSESQLPALERLFAELEARIADFRKLLDKPPKKEQSRQALCSGELQLVSTPRHKLMWAAPPGKITIGDEEYAINEEFKQGAIQLADTLNLDELEAARLFWSAQDDAATLDRSIFHSAVIRFHQYRQYLLECLRLVLLRSLDPGLENEEEGLSDTRVVFQEVVALILQPRDKASRCQPRFSKRCLSTMGDIKTWLQDLAGRVQSASVLGSIQLPEVVEMLEFQRNSLVRQHESLGAIICYLGKGNNTQLEDFEHLLNTAKAVDRFDDLLVHLLPAIVASSSRSGSVDGILSQSEAQAFHQKLASTQESSPWRLGYVRGAVRTLWLGEYSAWYTEPPDQALLTDHESQSEADARSTMFLEALKDGAFDFLLAVSIDVKPAEWYDPVRARLRELLQKKSPVIAPESAPFSDHFQLLLMEQLESFVDAFITNMPSTLRRLRVDEDLERMTTLEVHRGVDFDLDLERFIVMISYVYEHRADAAQSFWHDTDSNLFGFLQWVSKRLSTPRACAVSEMLIALSEGDDNSTAAHKFLLEESLTSASKLRKTHSLSWAHIFYEAQYFATKIRDEPVQTLDHRIYSANQVRTDKAAGEPETLNMLESYLRLMARLSRESSVARAWLLSHPTLRVLDLLFTLAGGQMPTDLRACAFDCLQALLRDKSSELGETVWLTLDQWISGAYTPGASTSKPGNTSLVPARVEEMAFAYMERGFDEPNAFVRLLQALVFPPVDRQGLNDTLPFPEHLGSTHRMPGIDPYVDFAVGRVFGTKLMEMRDTVQLRILRLSCLEFILTCLSTFNEDLLVFGSRSPVAADSAIGASSLAAYARLHPFARVMDWLFSDRVIEALFATTHQEVAELSNAPLDSPLSLGLICGIQIITAVLNLQVTYLDIVRPLVKASAPNRSAPVANASLASFEDAILNNLQLAVDLGLYCGIGNQELTMVSLTLLERLSMSRKLIASPTLDNARRLGRNKIIGIWEMNNESDRIAKSMVNEMQPDQREIGRGPETPGYLIKTNILRFLNRCIASLPNQPTVAHLLLGFTCTDANVEVDPSGAFAQDTSLFHTLLGIIAEYPDGGEGNMEAWLLDLKQAALRVLRQLWKAPITAIYTMTELRLHDFLFLLFVRQPVLSPNSSFDGLPVSDGQFLFHTSAHCFETFLRQRTAVLDYSTTEVRLVSQERTPTLQARILSTLLGNTATPEGEQLSNPSVFDLFDFVELEFGQGLAQPTLKYFAELDFEMCINRDEEPFVYDLGRVRQLLTLRHNELRKKVLLSTPTDEQDGVTEADSILVHLQTDNQRRGLLVARLDTLKAWVQLVMVMLESCDFEPDAKTTFILQALQLILPKLEKYSLENATEAMELALLSKALLANLRSVSSSLGKGRAGDVANDRLFHLFRVSLRGIHSPVATMELREVFYTISYRYLVGVSNASDTTVSLKRHSTQTIKASGERLIDVICDDAYAGEGTCRVSALLLLDGLLSLAQTERADYVHESLARLNFIGILVESIKHIPTELRETRAQGKHDCSHPCSPTLKLSDIPLLLSCYPAKLSLLLRISRTRPGATMVLDAGLFQSVRESQLFAADPDLGLGGYPFSVRLVENCA